MNASHLLDTLGAQGHIVIDGGLATALEARGYVLDRALWSAHLLLSAPTALRDVHRAYLDAGADCIISATYQATLAGFQDEGLSLKQAENALLQSVTLACEARDDHMQTITRNYPPIVAASVGPYGAVLCDGSEYRGGYALSDDALYDFHAARWELLVGSPADILACETIPDVREAHVIRTLLQETPAARAWVSFSCKDGVTLSDGTPLVESAALFDDLENVIAIGVNCVAPGDVVTHIHELHIGAPSKHIIVYPNSGEHYDGSTRRWTGCSNPLEFASAARLWHGAGATLIGGCCRTGPEHIAAVKAALCC
jgi:homocysteine S-methyltransferase